MYCSNCKKHTENDLLFCSECGQKCEDSSENQSYEKPKFDAEKHGKHLLNALVHPVKTMKSGGDEFRVQVNLIYVLIITILIPAIKTFAIKLFSFRLVKSLIDISNDFSGIHMSANEIAEIKKWFRAIMDTIFPTGKIYTFDLLSYVILYGFTILLIYLIFKYLVKENIDIKKISNILFVFSVVNLAFALLSAIAIALGLIAWSVVGIISGLVSILLIYAGFNTIVESKDKLVYIYPVVYIIAWGISVFFAGEFILSTIYGIANTVEKFI